MNRSVNIGGPVVLIVLGLIIALAVNYQISGIELSTIGWILVGGGVVWLLFGLIAGATGGKSRSTTHEHVDPNTGHRTTEHESEY